MPTGPERALRTPETERRDRRDRESTSETAAGRSAPSRRQTLAGIGSLSLGLTAGCLNPVQTLTGSRVPVEPEAPANWDDERNETVNAEEAYENRTATPGEFYFLLEQNGVTVDELYHDTDENDLILFYESDAETPTESDNEIWLIYRVFMGGLVARGTDIDKLYTEIVPESRFDGQVGGWAVNARWAEKHAAGQTTDTAVWNNIAGTKVYEDDEERNGDDTAAETADESGTASDQNGTNDGADSESSVETESNETESNETTTEE